MKKKELYAIGLLTFLLAFSILNPVIADDWGDPLATDPSGDGENPGEDIQLVDARYVNEFVYFRFKLYEYLYFANLYKVYIDFDKNTSSGDVSGESDIGSEISIECAVYQITPYLETDIYLAIYGGSNYQVNYNMTANNGTATSWNPDPSIDPYFDMVLYENISQGEVVFGVNWTWLCGLMVLQGVIGDNYSMYLEFEAGSASDWCPSRTGGDTDYIEWDIRSGPGPDGEIPGFPMAFTLLSLLTFLGMTILLHRNRLKF